MSTELGTSRQPLVTDLSRQLASAAMQMAEHCLAIDLAVARNDFDIVCESTEAAKVLCQRMTILYRQLLARRTTSTRISECSSI